MTEPKRSPQDELEELKKEYATKLIESNRVLDEAWREVVRAEWSREAVQALLVRIHHLAGSAGTFGFPAVSDAAGRLQLELKAILEAQLPPSATVSQGIGRGIVTLRKTCIDSARAAVGIRRKVDTAVLRSPFHSRHGGPVFVVHPQRDLARQLVLQICSFGYGVRTFADLSGLVTAARQEGPSAILLDLALVTGDGKAIQALSDLQEGRQPPIPLLFLSETDDLEARLAAVRAGGKAFFTMPIDFDYVIDVLGGLTSWEAPEPYRILIVEDDASIARYCSTVLDSAGMATLAVTESMSALARLQEFRPELILMDLYMPECDGLELAKVIRQQRAYDGVPIVYLSAETDVDKQLEAMLLGGDDFLTKPIRAEHLIGSIVARAQRSRLLRAYLVRDSLTGLPNHSVGMQQLDVSLMDAKARKARLGYALVDLDHFRFVNDYYGHATGDRILKTLGYLLKRRLRKGDVVWRYGGEEFGVILPDTDSLNVVQILDDIRKDFAEVRHRSESEEFCVTFSAGIATTPPHADVVGINEAAWKALQEAKDNGRNRLVLA